MLSSSQLSSQHHEQSLFKDALVVGLALLIIYTIAAAIIESKRVKGIHESGVAILLGILVSFIFYWAQGFQQESAFHFDESIFFYFILPPIIFAAGYNLKRRRFFSNIGGISMFGVLGTIICFFSISGFNILINSYYPITIQVYQQDPVDSQWKWSSLEFTLRQILLMSALLCSSDAVAALTIVKYDEQPKLFSLIFGEGILNDAVSIVLFKTVLLYTSPNETFQASTPFSIILRFLLLSLISVTIGLFVGLVCTYILKRCRFLTHEPVHEMAIIFFFGFLSYVLAELFEQSGIITLLICGVIMAHYAWYNLSPQAKHGTSLAFQMIGFGCQAFIFAYLGLVLFSNLNRVWSLTLIAFEFPIVCGSRLLGCFLLKTLTQLLCCKPFFLSWSQLTFLWFAGLIRGAIAFGLVLRLESEDGIAQSHRDVIITTTLVLVIFTTIVFGSLMPLVSKCLLEKKVTHSRNGSRDTMNFEMMHFRHPSRIGTAPQSSTSVHNAFLHPNMQRQEQSSNRTARNSTLIGREKRGTFKYYWKMFDHGIMKPIFIHKFDVDRQKRELQFMDGFMKAGRQWANQYVAKGSIDHATLHRAHSVISRSSEDDSDQEANLQASALVQQSLLPVESPSVHHKETAIFGGNAGITLQNAHSFGDNKKIQEENSSQGQESKPEFTEPLLPQDK